MLIFSEDAASSACPADVYSQSTDRQFIEESLTTCDVSLTSVES